MEIDDIRAMTDDELRAELDTASGELMSFRFQVATMQLSNVTVIRKGRKRIARIKTILRERELAKLVT